MPYITIKHPAGPETGPVSLNATTMTDDFHRTIPLHGQNEILFVVRKYVSIITSLKKISPENKFQRFCMFLRVDCTFVAKTGSGTANRGFDMANCWAMDVTGPPHPIHPTSRPHETAIKERSQHQNSIWNCLLSNEWSEGVKEGMKDSRIEGLWE